MGESRIPYEYNPDCECGRCKGIRNGDLNG